MSVDTVSTESDSAVVLYVDPESLLRNPYNPRRDEGDVTELAASIKEFGVLEPAVAFERDRADGQLGRELVLIAGHRRRKAGITAKVNVPVLVRPEPTIAEQIMLMLVENGQRNNLDPIEEARAYVKLLEEGVEQKDIARRCGRSEAHVSKRVAIVQKLPEVVLERFDKGELSILAAYELSRISDNAKLVERLTSQQSLNEKWILSDVAAELKRRGDADAMAKAKLAFTKSGVRVVPEAQVRNGTAAALVGNGEPRWDDRFGSVFWLAMTVEDHKDSPCHAAFLDAKAKAVWCCESPTSHAGIKTVKVSVYDPAPKKVDDLLRKSQPVKHVAPKVDPEIGAAYEAARARAVDRRNVIAAHLAKGTTVGDFKLVRMLPFAMSFDEGDLYTDVWITAQLLGMSLIERDQHSLAELMMDRVDHDAVIVALAVSAFEAQIFKPRQDRMDRGVTIASDAEYELPNWYRSGEWTDDTVPALADLYVAWLERIGLERGPIEDAWLELCKESYAAATEGAE